MRAVTIMIYSVQHTSSTLTSASVCVDFTCVTGGS